MDGAKLLLAATFTADAGLLQCSTPPPPLLLLFLSLSLLELSLIQTRTCSSWKFPRPAAFPQQLPEQWLGIISWQKFSACHWNNSIEFWPNLLIWPRIACMPQLPCTQCLHAPPPKPQHAPHTPNTRPHTMNNFAIVEQIMKNFSLQITFKASREKPRKYTRLYVCVRVCVCSLSLRGRERGR